MRFALVDGQRREAESGLSGECDGCGSALVAKCGEVRVWHWAHRGRRSCDLWCENETEWHRSWRARFPDDWQEVLHHAADGERHRADVKTAHGWALEFQRSFIKPEERRSREAFYAKLMWVVDGTRRKRDKAQFLKAVEESTPLSRSSPFRRVWSGEGALLRDWVVSAAHVFFDFGDEQKLWWLSPASDTTRAYVMPVSVSEFLEIHRQIDGDGADRFDRMAQVHARALTDLRGLRNAEQARSRPSPLNPRRSPRKGRRL